MLGRVGSRLGPYEIVAPLGAGGMGHVYRARDDRLGRDIAIKVLPDDVVPDADTLKRFEREARAVAALNHPNILAIHDVGNADGVVYIVTELLEGTTLRERLQGGALAPRRALDYAIQMAHGLGAAHERGVVHRDLKPENLFITRDGRLKILDFGVAQIEGRTTGQRTQATVAVTQPGMVVGTPGYMSPEQITGEGATTRSDLFAFGLVVYEMLSGTQPFKRSTAPESLSALLRDDPVPLTHNVPGVPTALARIIERCLEKRPADRPGSAADLGLYLEALGSDASTQPLPVVSAAPPGRIARRILTVSCALLLLVAGATWAYVQVMANGAVSAALETALARAEGVVQRVHTERLTRLSLTARLVASIPQLKALFETDAATIRDFLLFHQQRNPGSPLLIALSQGRVLARTDTVAAHADAPWMSALQAADGEAAVIDIDGRLYHAAAAAAEAGTSIFGYVVAAIPVDATFAQAISASTQDDAVLLSTTTVLAGTLRAGSPWKSLKEWRAAGGRTDRSLDVRIGAQQFVAREVKLADNPALSTITIKSRDDAIGPYRRIQRGVLVIGLLGIAAAIAGSLWIGAAGQR